MTGGGVQNIWKNLGAPSFLRFMVGLKSFFDIPPKKNAMISHWGGGVGERFSCI